MKKVSVRAYSALLIALAVIVGLCIYVSRFISDGEDWALYFNAGRAKTTLTDRNGVVLAERSAAGSLYAEDAAVRTACYQLVGDYAGNVGTGALQRFSKQMLKYDPVFGVAEGKDRTLALTVDSALNTAAYYALGGRKGAVLVSDYTTGEILCEFSSPCIDPLYPPEELPDGVYLNRCISSSFVPGSIFKLVTAAAAIENIPDLYERTFYCGGSIDVKGVTVTCTGTHGDQTIEQALANSCNCAFGQLALELGADKLAEYAESFGITQSHSLDGIDTARGNFDPDVDGSPALAWSGIGQYNDLVCPYSMLRIVSAIANGGVLYEPSLLGAAQNGTRLMSADTAKKLADMMSYNVAANYGEYNFPGLNIAAKTGTAELGNGEADHGWFVGFLNDPEHPYAFTVLVENGGSGLGAAAPVANAVLQTAVKSLQP